MSTLPRLLADTIELSLTPFSWRRQVGARLRAGEPPGDIVRVLAPNTNQARQRLARLPGLARAAFERARQTSIRCIGWNDPDYPASLVTLDDPPPVLWVRGDPAVLAGPAVALVGSRAGSAYATTVAGMLAADLAAAGVIVVSGLARGVDVAAHRGALRAGGGTLAVLGSGVDVIYPPEHRPMAEAMSTGTRTALVSELPPGTRPLHWFFPLRNRIISGLSQAVVIVEAGKKSGSLITARCALEQGREVLAVPGSVLGGRNHGGHALLRDGAKLVESADDIVEELGWQPARMHPAPQPEAPPPSDGHDPVLTGWMAGESRDFDEILASSGLEAGRILSRLLELELRGTIGRAGGGRFVRLDRSC